jgi:hypothetical protein
VIPIKAVERDLKCFIWLGIDRLFSRIERSRIFQMAFGWRRNARAPAATTTMDD